MKQLLYGLQLLALLCLFDSATSYRGAARVSQVKPPPMSKPLTTVEQQWADRTWHGINKLERYLAAADAIQCFGNHAQVLVDGGTAVCMTTGRHRFTTHIPPNEDPSLEPKQYQRAEDRINEFAFKFRLLPKALKPLVKEDPRALMALIGLSPRQRQTASRKLGRLLAEEDAMNSQNLPVIPPKPTVPSGSASKKASRDNKNIEKWWGKAHPKSSRKDRTSFDRRADSDDEGVGLIVAYVARKAFADLLDFLDDDPSFGLDADEDDIPKNLLSSTAEWKKYPAIFKGDEPVWVREANFYAAQEALHPGDDDED
ncbi:hypothetical protein ACHAPT_007272 [Fusarium lateritium]